MAFTTTRRAALFALAATPLLPRSLRAQAAFPDRPVRLIVPFAPGGNSDLTARACAPAMAAKLGQPVVVENRAGAGGSVAAQQVARLRPDGYTILLGSNGPLTINPAVQANLGYDPLRDFTTIGMFVRTPMVIAVHRSMPPRTLAELIAYAKANPGRVGFGSSGIASTAHLSLEMFNAATGAAITHIPYGSGGALAPDLVSGTLSGAVTEISTALPLHREGSIRILAVAAADRLPQAPELPTATEAGVAGYQAAAFVGIVAPTGVPEDAAKALGEAVAAAVADPGVRQRLEGMGSLMASAEEARPAGFAGFLQRETDWTRAAAQRAGLRPG